MNNGKVVNIALVGAGGFAARYRHRYTQIPGARLALVVASREESARSAAEELNVEKWSTNFEDALAPEIDIIDIGTPNHLHKEQSIRAMEAGKHIIVQKPIAPTIEDGEEMVEVARRTGVKASMYMNMLENPLYHDIKRLIKQGYLGRIANVYCRGAARGGEKKAPDGWRNSLEKTGGGAFVQKTLHFLNLAQWMLDDRVCRVVAFSKNRMCANIAGDDTTSAACEFTSGVVGSLEASYISAPHMIAVYGTKGFVVTLAGKTFNIQLDDPYDGEVIHYDRPGELLSFTYDFLDAKKLFINDNPYDQHVAFVKAVQQDLEVPVPLEVGVYDLKVVKAVYESARTGRVVEVK